MKSFILPIFMMLISAAAFSQVNAQTNLEKPESPYNVMNLKFALDTATTPEDVGFDDPKSYWKFKYELRFLENGDSDLEKSGFKYFQEIPNENSIERSKRIKRNNEELAKVWKKLGVRVVKGKFSKSSLFSEENREAVIPIALPLEIQNALSRANSANIFPDFRIEIKGKLYTKTKSNLKFKEKFSQSYVCPTKMIVKGVPAWMMNNCGIYMELTNENNKISIGSSSRL